MYQMTTTNTFSSRNIIRTSDIDNKNDAATITTTSAITTKTREVDKGAAILPALSSSSTALNGRYRCRSKRRSAETTRTTTRTATPATAPPSMKRSLRRIATAAAAGTLFLRPVNAAPVQCKVNSPETGYTSIAALNQDMQSELALIASGSKVPESTYTFQLCSDLVFDLSTTGEPLRPVLSNSFVLCGQDGSSRNACTILGGTATQVQIVDSAVSSYPLSQVTLQGLTFSGFTTESITASATFPTKLNLLDVIWTDFESNYAIRQALPPDVTSVLLPMTVEVETALVTRGTTGAMFDNAGGLLRVSNLTVTSVVSPALVSTGQGGNSFLQDSLIQQSELDSVTIAVGGAAQRVRGVQVTQMKKLEDAFLVREVGSVLTVAESKIYGNSVTSTRWSAFTSTGGATGVVTNCLVENNVGMEFGANAIGPRSSMAVLDSQFVSNGGTTDQGFISAEALALSQGSVTVERVQFTGGVGFTASVISLLNSQISVTQSCFQEGNSKYVVFVDPDSIYGIASNFVSGYSSTECPTGNNNRLFQENPGSGCLVGGNICQGACTTLADQALCLASAVPTLSPIPGETLVPTTRPNTLSTNPPTSVSTTPQPTIPPTSFSTNQPPTHPTVTPVQATTASPTGTPTAATLQPSSPTDSPSTARGVTPSYQPKLSNLPTSTAGSPTDAPYTRGPSVIPSSQPTATHPTPTPRAPTIPPATTSPPTRTARVPTNPPDMTSPPSSIPRVPLNLPTSAPTPTPGVPTISPTASDTLIDSMVEPTSIPIFDFPTIAPTSPSRRPTTIPTNQPIDQVLTPVPTTITPTTKAPSGIPGSPTNVPTQRQPITLVPSTSKASPTFTSIPPVIIIPTLPAPPSTGAPTMKGQTPQPTEKTTTTAPSSSMEFCMKYPRKCFFHASKSGKEIKGGSKSLKGSEGHGGKGVFILMPLPEPKIGKAKSGCVETSTNGSKFSKRGKGCIEYHYAPKYVDQSQETVTSFQFYPSNGLGREKGFGSATAIVEAIDDRYNEGGIRQRRELRLRSYSRDRGGVRLPHVEAEVAPDATISESSD